MALFAGVSEFGLMKKAALEFWQKNKKPKQIIINDFKVIGYIIFFKIAYGILPHKCKCIFFELNDDRKIKNQFYHASSS